MDVSSMSRLMGQVSVGNQEVQIAMMKKILDTTVASGDAMTQMLAEANVQAPHPNLGKNLDISV